MSGNVQGVGKDLIIVRNRNQDGDLFIFDRNGKALRKINRKGQGGEEYVTILLTVLDEYNSEIFVCDNASKKIVVYDLFGNFKRSFKNKVDFQYDYVYNFDHENLICHSKVNDYNATTSVPDAGQSFMLISKHDGSITEEINIPCKTAKSVMIWQLQDNSSEYRIYVPSTSRTMVPYFNDYILAEISADTIYRYSEDRTMTPVIVRTPPIESMVPEVFLYPNIFTDRYYFMEAIKHELPFPGKDLVYDRQEKAIFQYKVYNADYTGKEEVFMKSPL